MRSLLELMRLEAFTPKGRRIGRVAAVIFHPSEPRVVGFTVSRPALLFVIERPDRQVALDRCSVVSVDERERLVVAPGRDAWDVPAQRRLGLEWERSVEWLGMPVETESGVPVGLVRDALVDPESGALGGLGITEGVTTDVLIGTRDVSATDVRGFDGRAVRVADAVIAVERDGGAAAAAGRGAARAKQVAGKAVESAAYATGRAVATAANSRAGRKVGGWLKALKDEVADAMGDPDE